MSRKTAAATVILLAFATPRANAGAPRQASEYNLTTWQQREGLPWGPVFGLAQTPDGYLWLPTAAGLMRFDGYRFTPWQPAQGPSLPSAYITALHTGGDGSLWVGFIDGRISRIRNGQAITYTTSDGLASRRVRSILDSQDGTIWVGYDPVGLSTFHDGVWRPVRGDDGTDIAASCLFQDSRRRVWICANGAALWRSRQQGFTAVGPSAADVRSIVEDAQGRVVAISIGGTIRVIEGQSTRRYEHVRGLSSARSSHVDRQGNLWIATSTNGLFRIRNDDAAGDAQVEHFAKPEGLSSDAVQSLLEDVDGNVWVGTSNGLNRFSESKLRSIVALAGRTSVLANSIAATPDGSVWVGTGAGLTRFETDGDQHLERETVLSDNMVVSLHYDEADGLLRTGTGRGVAVIAPGRASAMQLLRLPDLAAPFAMARERGGPLWFADGANGAVRWDPRLAPPAVRVGRQPAASAALADRQGAVWIGYNDGHVLRSADGQAHLYSVSEGLSGGPVLAIYEDRSRKLWVCTDRGLSRLDGNRFITFTRAQGLPADFVSELIEDGTGVFWLGTGVGIARVNPREFDRAAADATHRIEYRLYDDGDGLRGMPVHYGNPGATRTRDGRLWFLTQGAIAIVDPTRTSTTRSPPLVHIEAVSADDGRMHLSTAVQLPARTKNVTIDYTAPDLSTPQKVRFKYRLEGLEDEWRDVGSRRQAFYNNLPPGRYHFHVVACNGDGVWNETGASVAFAVLPTFYQTRWFQAAVVCALLLAMWGAHRVRLWQIARALRVQFETRASDRARIAEELHDTLIQDLAALNLQAEMIDDQLPREPGAAKETLGSLRTRMQRVVSDGRRGMTELHAGVTNSDDLADALSRVAQELRGPNGPAFHIVVQGHPRSLHPLVGDEVYRIAREAMTNAFRHAAASRIDVEVSFASHELRVRVRDDGRGIAEEVIQGGRPHHFGLHGMRRRAKQIGATVTVWSRANEGTEIAVIVPARAAFQRV